MSNYIKIIIGLIIGALGIYLAYEWYGYKMIAILFLLFFSESIRTNIK